LLFFFDSDNTTDEKLKYEKTVEKLQALNKTIESRKLNQKADRLHIPRFHLKYENITNYANTSLPKNSVLKYINSQKKVRLHRDTFVVVVFAKIKEKKFLIMKTK